MPNGDFVIERAVQGKPRFRCVTVAHRVAHRAAQQMEAGSTHG
jgi:hypothetical protein